MHSLRMDNSRLNQLVKTTQIPSSDNNNETAVEATDSKRHLHQASSGEKLQPDFEDLSFPSKNLGMNLF